MKHRHGIALAAAGIMFGSLATPAIAATEIQWWHAMGGALGETVNDIAAGFNRSQNDYVIKAVYKGNYTETMTAGIAAFRSGKPPHIMQVFEVGTATMMAASHGTPHGVACSFSLPFVMRAVIGADDACDAALRAIFGGDLPAAADGLEAFLESLGVGTRPQDQGIDAAEWHDLVATALEGERGRNFIGDGEALLSGH